MANNDLYNDADLMVEKEALINKVFDLAYTRQAELAQDLMKQLDLLTPETSEEQRASVAAVLRVIDVRKDEVRRFIEALANEKILERL